MSKSHFFVEKREEIFNLAKKAKIDSIVLHPPLFEEWDEEKSDIDIIVTQKDAEDKGDLNKRLIQFKMELKKIAPFYLGITPRDETELLVSGIVDEELLESSKNIVASAIPLEKITRELLSEQFKRSMDSCLKRNSVSTSTSSNQNKQEVKERVLSNNHIEDLQVPPSLVKTKEALFYSNSNNNKNPSFKRKSETTLTQQLQTNGTFKYRRKETRENNNGLGNSSKEETRSSPRSPSPVGR